MDRWRDPGSRPADNAKFNIIGLPQDVVPDCLFERFYLAERILLTLSPDEKTLYALIQFLDSIGKYRSRLIPIKYCKDIEKRPWPSLLVDIRNSHP